MLCISPIISFVFEVSETFKLHNLAPSTLYNRVKTIVSSYSLIFMHYFEFRVTEIREKVIKTSVILNTVVLLILTYQLNAA